MLKYEDLRRKLLRINKHRDVETKIVLKPGEVSGTSDVEIQAHDLYPFHLSLDANNLGTRDTGRTRYGVTATHTNLFGRADEWTTRYQAGTGSWAILNDYVTPINYDWGTRLGLSYSHAHVDVGGEFASLDRLTVVEEPDVAPSGDEVAIAVRASGVNFVDALLVTGKYQLKPPLPFTPGGEIAGDVVALGRSPAARCTRPTPATMPLDGAAAALAGLQQRRIAGKLALTP